MLQSVSPLCERHTEANTSEPCSQRRLLPFRHTDAIVILSQTQRRLPPRQINHLSNVINLRRLFSILKIKVLFGFLLWLICGKYVFEARTNSVIMAYK